MSEALKELMGNFSNKKTTISTGKVTKIDGSICEVEREHLPPLLDVRLQALSGDFDNHLLIKPKKDSQVVCLSVDGENAETCIVKYTEIESVEVKVDGVIVKLEHGKIQLKNDNTDFKELLNDLLSELKSAVIQTPSGPGKFSPNNKLKFEQMQTQTNQLFE